MVADFLQHMVISPNLQPAISRDEMFNCALILIKFICQPSYNQALCSQISVSRFREGRHPLTWQTCLDVTALLKLLLETGGYVNTDWSAERTKQKASFCYHWCYRVDAITVQTAPYTVWLRTCPCTNILESVALQFTAQCKGQWLYELLVSL